MSSKTLPLLFINLGGEMLYILDQRLKAQNIPPEKSQKVMYDITATMFNKRFMEELFKPQELYSKKAMRTVFDRLAHASIMRLNTASMDKLYDLMTMAFKYQVSLSLRPKDVLLVTLNHIDTIYRFVEGSPPVRQQVEFVHRLLTQHYASLSLGEFMLIRQTLLNFFQDMHIRVSIFLKDRVQNSNGRFALPMSGCLPWGSEPPGSIRLFNSRGGQDKSLQFIYGGGKFVMAPREGSCEPRGDRVTKLGTNMYNVSRPVEALPTKNSVTRTTSGADMDPPNPLAKAQLDLLSKLIGGKEGTKKGFRLNLFQTDEDEEQAALARPPEMPGSRVVNIDASKKKHGAELTRIMGELNVDDDSDNDGDDLLDLMDKAY